MMSLKGIDSVSLRTIDVEVSIAWADRGVKSTMEIKKAVKKAFIACHKLIQRNQLLFN